MYPKITVGSRFFFFSSLREAEDLKARNLATEVDDILNQNPLSREDDDGEENITQALNFLEQMYLRELSIERQYFSSKVLKNPIIENNPKYTAMAKACFSETEIDYPLFMSLLKLIESETTGTDYEERFNQIKQEVKNFQSAVTSWTDAHNKDIEDFPSPNFIISKLFNELDYANKREQSAVHKALNRTKVINNAILGSKLSKDTSIFVNQVQKTIVPFLLSNNNNQILNINQERAFTSEIALYLLEELENIKNQSNQEINLDDILNDLVINSSNSNETNSLATRISKYADHILGNLTLLEQQGKQITPITNKIKIEKQKITGLTKEVRAKLAEILNEIDPNLNKDFEKTKFRTKKAKEQYLSRLKKDLKLLIGMPTNSRMNTKQEIQLLNELLATHSKFTMYDETEYRSARGLQAILKTAIPEVVGKSLGKTDVSMLDIGQIQIEYNIDDNIISELLSDYDQNFENNYQVTRQQISHRVYNDKLFSQQNSFNLMAQTEAVSQAQKSLADSIANFPPNISLSNKSAREELENVFIIDNSVKHSDFIFNGKGFSGGSLGSGIIEQINNICDFFELGGITPVDRNWLIFATLNCGNGLMGAHLRPSLEDYFSVVASMLLFRTGGLLADQISSEGQQYVSANNIHIFTLGPLYVPASYILLTTLEALQEADNLITRAAAGSKTVIRNNVTEKDKYTENVKLVDGQTVKVGQWYETYARNYSRVSINVQLLAGFLDILEEIEKRAQEFLK